MSDRVRAARIDISWRCWMVWRRHLDVFRKYWVGAVLAYFADPLFYLLALGVGLGNFISRIQGQSYTEFIAPALLLTTSMMTACMECTYGSFTRMDVQKTFEAMVATPLTLDDVVGGELLYGATKSLLISLAVMLVIAAFSAVHSPWILISLVLVVWCGILFGAISLIATSFAASYEYVNYYYALFMMPILFFSGIFFPLENLQEQWRWLSWLSPLTPMVAAARRWAYRAPAPADWAPMLPWIPLTLLFCWIAAYRIKRRLVV